MNAARFCFYDENYFRFSDRETANPDCIGQAVKGFPNLKTTALSASSGKCGTPN